ncbi:MAG: methyltransferase domain-containing protein [Anaerolineae bacterium]|nr:methyltransferase domain-containing protein [Anaerolineae bacterium]
MTTAEKFDSSLSKWLSSLDEPWNRLRYAVFRHNLKRHLPEGALRILDAGGGSGSDAIPLALDGHQVTLVDFSAQMLDQARQNAEASGAADRMTFQQADVMDIPALFPEPAFDAVLCHNVIQYVEDMPGAVKAICAPLKPGGVVSVININRYSDTLQAALLRLDLDQAREQIGLTEAYTPMFETTLKRYAGEEMIAPLEAADCALLGHYGVRCVNDYIQDNTLKADPEFYARLERLEIALSSEYPYYLIARFFQLIAQKQEPIQA